MKELRSAEWDRLLFFSLYIICVFPLSLSLFISLPSFCALAQFQEAHVWGTSLHPKSSLSRNVAPSKTGSEASNQAEFGEHESPCRNKGEAKGDRPKVTENIKK